MPGVAKLMEIILKYFIHIPFIGNSVDFVIGGYKAGKEFFSVELCMECTDLLVFLYWCRELIRKLRFPCDRFCFFQKISFLTIFFRKYCVYFQHDLFGNDRTFADMDLLFPVLLLLPGYPAAAEAPAASHTDNFPCHRKEAS